jgi:hypothetical protein
MTLKSVDFGKSKQMVVLSQQVPPPAAAPAQPSIMDEVRGLRSWYAQGHIGLGVDEVSKCDPSTGSCNAPISESKYTLFLGALVGWGPIRTEHVMFNTHYRYTQNWSTDYTQVERFLGSYFDTYKAQDFLFPTKSLLRVHEIAFDLRGIWNPVQAGLFTRLSWARVGSSTFGEKLEEAETVATSENFVPYVSYKYDRFYRAQFSIPLRTEINRDDPRLSNTTYSISSEGRGRILSFKLSNAGYIEPIDSLVFLDLFQTQLKYSAISEDRTRLGLSGSFNFPIVETVRASPKVGYFRENYIVNRARIPGYSKEKAKDLINVKAEEVERNDNYLSLGLSLHWDFSANSRVELDVARESNTSSLPEFNKTTNFLKLGYTYSWPSQNMVSKRVDRFVESPYAEEF